MNLNEILLINSFPTLDLHEFDRETGRVAVLDFINDHYKMKDELIVIIHGIHGEILRKMVHQTLNKHKQVLEYKTFPFNPGCTLVKLRFDK